MTTYFTNPNKNRKVDKKMGVMSAARALANGGMANIRLSSQILKEVNTLIKARSKEEVSQALLDDASMTAFGESIYEKLSLPLKNQVPLAGFIDLVLKNRQTLMKKPRNVKKAQKK
ncbi:hypothetical protein [Pseudomonas sp. Leaf58]|nr:hypothetical protein [Pseudomonas sp. Leaf58]